MRSKLTLKPEDPTVTIGDLGDGVLAIIQDVGSNFHGCVVSRTYVLDKVYILGGTLTKIDEWEKPNHTVLKIKVRILKSGEKLELFNAPQKTKK